MTTWRIEISLALQNNMESWNDVVANTLSEKELDYKFDEGYGKTEGRPFGVWTKDYVYFPAGYDGSEWVDKVPRNPRKEPIDHIGGG